MFLRSAKAATVVTPVFQDNLKQPPAGKQLSKWETLEVVGTVRLLGEPAMVKLNDMHT